MLVAILGILVMVAVVQGVALYFHERERRDERAVAEAVSRSIVSASTRLTEVGIAQQHAESVANLVLTRLEALSALVNDKLSGLANNTESFAKSMSKDTSAELQALQRYELKSRLAADAVAYAQQHRKSMLDVHAKIEWRSHNVKAAAMGYAQRQVASLGLVWADPLITEMDLLIEARVASLDGRAPQPVQVAAAPAEDAAAAVPAAEVAAG